MTSASARFLAELVGGTLHGDRDPQIRGIADLREAGPADLCFLQDPKYAALARATRAGVLLTSERVETSAVQIVVPEVRLAYAKVALHFHPEPRARVHRIHESAIIEDGVELEEPVEIGARVVVERGTRIGKGSVLMTGVVVGRDSRIGRDCVLHRGVVLEERVALGDRVMIHAGAIVGADGFGYAHDGARWVKFPQVGTVVIADDVDIGAGCTIDRGAIGTTRIGRGTKMDNLVHVGHNTVIGSDCVIAGCCVFSGSVTIGNHVTIGGHSSFNGHIKVCDGARIGGNSGVLKDITEPGDYMGYPIMEMRRCIRTFRVITELLELRDSVKELEKERDGRTRADVVKVTKARGEPNRSEQGPA